MNAHSVAQFSHVHTIVFFEQLVDHVKHLDGQLNFQAQSLLFPGFFELRVEIDYATASALTIQVDPGEQIRPDLSAPPMIRVLPRHRGQDQLRVLVKGHTGRRKPHPVGESGDVQLKTVIRRWFLP